MQKNIALGCILLQLALLVNSLPTNVQPELSIKPEVEESSHIESTTEFVKDFVMPLLNGTDIVVERAGECKPVGNFCSLSEECCSKRCLHFAAKCVT